MISSASGTIVGSRRNPWIMPFGLEQLHADAEVLEQPGVGDRLVAQRIALGDHDDRRRRAREVLEHQRRDARVAVIGPPVEVEPVVVAQVVDVEHVTDAELVHRIGEQLRPERRVDHHLRGDAQVLVPASGRTQR